MFADRCGTCQQFILGNDKNFLNLDKGECKDRATVYIESPKCDTFKKSSTHKILWIKLNIWLRETKIDLEDRFIYP